MSPSSMVIRKDDLGFAQRSSKEKTKCHFEAISGIFARSALSCNTYFMNGFCWDAFIGIQFNYFRETLKKKSVHNF